MRAARLAVLAGALALAPSGLAATSAPGLRLLDLSPVRVQGTHFASGERVKLTLRAGAAVRTRTTRASTRGVFTVSFGRLDERDRCSGLVSVAAAGAGGHRAAYKLPAMACPAMTSGPYR